VDRIGAGESSSAPPPRAWRWRLGSLRFLQLLVAILLVILIVAWLIPVIERAQQAEKLAQCKDNLRQIGGELILYARANGGMLPVSPTLENPHAELLQSLAAEKFISDPKIFYCPAVTEPSCSYSQENFKAGKIGYFYYSAMSCGPDQTLSNFLRNIVVWPRRLDTTMDPKTWIMSDIWNSAVPTAHPGFKKGVNYLMLDGRVDFLTESPRHSFR
jgi:prepilin-type processing-associated H-X9-DG protein